MEFKTLKSKKKEDLVKLLDEKRIDLKEMRFKVASKETANVREIRKTRKEIAQLLTALKEHAS